MDKGRDRRYEPNIRQTFCKVLASCLEKWKKNVKTNSKKRKVNRIEANHRRQRTSCIAEGNDEAKKRISSVGEMAVCGGRGRGFGDSAGCFLTQRSELSIRGQFSSRRRVEHQHHRNNVTGICIPVNIISERIMQHGAVQPAKSAISSNYYHGPPLVLACLLPPPQLFYLPVSGSR